MLSARLNLMEDLVFIFSQVFFILSCWILFTWNALTGTESKVWIWQIIDIFLIFINHQTSRQSFYWKWNAGVTWLLNNSTEVVTGHWAGNKRALCASLYMQWSSSLFVWREIENNENYSSVKYICCLCSLNYCFIFS